MMVLRILADSALWEVGLGRFAPCGGRLPAGVGHSADVVILRIYRDNSADSVGCHQSERRWLLDGLTPIGVATEESTSATAAEQTPGKTVGRAVPEDCHSASAGYSGTPTIRPSMTRFTTEWDEIMVVKV